MRTATRTPDARTLLVLLSVVICCPTLPGLAAERSPINMQFVHLNQDHDLSQNTVEAIIEDRRGFMWFGTIDGLNRYDGNSFTVYRNDPDDLGSLSGNSAFSLLEDREGVLWVGVDNGLNRYDRDNDSFVRIRSDPNDPRSLSRSTVRALFEDSDGEIWVGGGGRISRLDRRAGNFTHYDISGVGSEANRSDWPVWRIIEDHRGFLWLGSKGGGLSQFDRRTGSFVHYLHDAQDPASLSHNAVHSLCEDHLGQLWIGTALGLNCFDRDTGTFQRFLHNDDAPDSLSSDHVDAIFEDEQQRLWIGTDGGGLNLFQRESLTFADFRHIPEDPNSLSSDVIRTIYEDSKGDLWIGSYDGGINFHNQNNAAFATDRRSSTDTNSLSDNAVTAILEDDQGVLWIGTDRGGLNRFDPETDSYHWFQNDPEDPESLSEGGVLSLYKDSRGNFWVGNYFGGLNRFDPQEGVFEHFQPDPNDPAALSNPHVWDILEDRGGRLWVATFGGLNRFDYDTSTFTDYRTDPNDATSIANNIIWSLFEDSGGHLWVATRGGVSVYDPEQDNFRSYFHDDNDSSSLSHDQVHVILEDHAGRLWFGTGGGLNLFDRATQTFTALRQADGLPNDTVLGILEDDQEFLWISTNAGISKFDPATHIFINYDKSNGLLAFPFKRNAYFKSDDGKLFFGGKNGVNSFYPRLVEDNVHVPPVVLTEFQVFNKPVTIGRHDSPLARHITEARQIRLGYDQSVFSFEFAALNFRSPDKNQYAYMLDNFDEDWMTVGSDRKATYTNLNPGNYRFRVKASNNSGVWNEQGVSIAIVISPPFWATWWFRFSCVALFAMSLVGIHTIRTRSITARNAALQVENEVRRNSEEELRHQLVRQTRLATIGQMTASIAHEIRNPLGAVRNAAFLLKRKFSEADPKQTQYFDIIDKEVRQVDRVIRDMLEMARAKKPTKLSFDIAATVREMFDHLSTNTGVRFELTCTPEPFIIVADREQMCQVINNLLNNAVQAMDGNGEVCVEIRADHEHDLLLFQDSGPGVDTQQRDRLFEPLFTTKAKGTGLGLAICRQIIERHGGTIEFQDHEGTGALFCVRLPKQ
ncbi:MAG: two-component regulator propeller domain-containing protein [Fuerstiella sp.]